MPLRQKESREIQKQRTLFIGFKEIRRLHIDQQRLQKNRAKLLFNQKMHTF